MYTHLQTLSPLNTFVSLAAFSLGLAQLLFIFNFFYSLRRGPHGRAQSVARDHAGVGNPSPPPHGNFGEMLPEVHRWAYDYSQPGAAEDYTPQTVPAAAVPAPGGAHGGGAA